MYRRAELLEDESQRSLIKDLYIDPLPSEHIFRTVLKPSTTMLIGRKGTGKSTIFQRVQFELRQMNGFGSAYVDIKTVYEASTTDPKILSSLGDAALSIEQIRRLTLYRAFIRAVIDAIKEEVKKKFKEANFWERIKTTLSASVDDLFEALDELLEEAETAEFLSVLGIKKTEIQNRSELTETQGVESNIGIEAGTTTSLKAGISAKGTNEAKQADELKYSDILMRIFNIKEIILQLKSILGRAGIRHLYVFIDDFSELPEDAMTVIVDTLLAPLNNWSEELIKFKIAAYPHRLYYGQIDKTKIDEIYLDLYRLYGTTDVTGMEEKAIDFTRRLVEGRLYYFSRCSLSTFTESSDEGPWRLLFYASMGNPRILGHLMYYLQESHLIFGSPIGSKAIRDAARRYYEEKIEPYFRMSRFLHESFAERASIFSLKELLESIVERARDLKRHRDSEVMREIPGTPPTSHFHVAVELESLLATLELNFFVTKYYEMSDRDGRKVSVYALNFGLCQKYAIAFGRPAGRREHRLYLVERIFDDTPLLHRFMQQNQEIRCDSCNETFELDKLPALQMFSMRCPKCNKGTCCVTNLSKKYESLLASVSPALLLPQTELGILQTLASEKRPMFAAEIGDEMDKSYQLIGKRGKVLAERGLVNRFETDQGRRAFEITHLAEESYFSNDSEVQLEVPPEPDDTLT